MIQHPTHFNGADTPRSVRRRVRGALRFITLVTGLAITSVCQAQWSVTEFDPPSGYKYAVGTAISPTNQFGFIDSFSGGNEFSYAVSWSYTAGSLVNMNPAGALQSKIFSAAGTQQVGQVQIGGNYVAGLWNGSASSFVNLGTAGFTTTEADSTDGLTQVGTGWTNGVPVALLWKGTAGSVVDLDPVGAAGYSQALTVDGNLEGGYCLDTGIQTAVLWHGTAASMTGIAPANSTSSQVNVVNQGEAGGYATFGTNTFSQAGIWTNDTAGSWINLAPAGSRSSYVSDLNGNYQIGTVTSGTSGPDHAAFWMGTAGSYVDLNQFLPSGYNLYSEANAMYVDPTGGIWIIGNGGNFNTNVASAFVWHYTPSPEPCSLAALGVGVIALLRRRRRREISRSGCDQKEAWI